jgi:hypothetical protein
MKNKIRSTFLNIILVIVFLLLVSCIFEWFDWKLGVILLIYFIFNDIWQYKRNGTWKDI